MTCETPRAVEAYAAVASGSLLQRSSRLRVAQDCRRLQARTSATATTATRRRLLWAPTPHQDNPRPPARRHLTSRMSTCAHLPKTVSPQRVRLCQCRMLSQTTNSRCRANGSLSADLPVVQTVSLFLKVQTLGTVRSAPRAVRLALVPRGGAPVLSRTCRCPGAQARRCKAHPRRTATASPAHPQLDLLPAPAMRAPAQTCARAPFPSRHNPRTNNAPRALASVSSWTRGGASLRTIWQLCTRVRPRSTFPPNSSPHSALRLQCLVPSNKCSAARASTLGRTVRRTLVDHNMADQAKPLRTASPHPHSSTLHPCSHPSSRTVLPPPSQEASRKGTSNSSSSLFMDSRRLPEVLSFSAARRCPGTSPRSSLHLSHKPCSSNSSNNSTALQAPARRLLSHPRVASLRRRDSTRTTGAVCCSMVCIRSSNILG